MSTINYELLLSKMKGQTVMRPNASTSGTLSGHAAGEPFGKLVYNELKKMYPHNIFKQYEYLNDLYRTHPKAISLEDKKALFESPVALFLLSRGDSATRLWNPQNIFEEKQNDTADILFHDNKFFEIIDVKTRNMAKSAMAPNIISAYKVAQMCTFIIDNEEYDTINIRYIEIDSDNVAGISKAGSKSNNKHLIRSFNKDKTIGVDKLKLTLDKVKYDKETGIISF